MLLGIEKFNRWQFQMKQKVHCKGCGVQRDQDRILDGRCFNCCLQLHKESLANLQPLQEIRQSFGSPHGSMESRGSNINVQGQGENSRWNSETSRDQQLNEKVLQDNRNRRQQTLKECEKYIKNFNYQPVRSPESFRHLRQNYPKEYYKSYDPPRFEPRKSVSRDPDTYSRKSVSKEDSFQRKSVTRDPSMTYFNHRNQTSKSPIRHDYTRRPSPQAETWAKPSLSHNFKYGTQNQLAHYQPESRTPTRKVFTNHQNNSFARKQHSPPVDPKKLNYSNFRYEVVNQPRRTQRQTATPVRAKAQNCEGVYYDKIKKQLQQVKMQLAAQRWEKGRRSPSPIRRY